MPIVLAEAPEALMLVVPVIEAPPAVAVIPPVVAISPAEEVKVPVTAVLPVAFPIFTAPVPPVPIVVTAAPEALMFVVPICVNAPSVDNPVTPKVPLSTSVVRSIVPKVATPVTLSVPPTVALSVTARLVPAVRVVVDAIVPGATNVSGIDHMSEFTPLVVVIWSTVPSRSMLFEIGETATLSSPVSVFTSLAADPTTAQTPAPDVW